MVRFSLGDDDSSDDDASEPQGSPLVSPETMVLRDSNARRFPRTPSPRRATPGAKAAGEDRRRSSDLERARRAAVDAEADAAVAGLRARIRDLSTGDAAPPGEPPLAGEPPLELWPVRVAILSMSMRSIRSSSDSPASPPSASLSLRRLALITARLFHLPSIPSNSDSSASASASSSSRCVGAIPAARW